MNNALAKSIVSSSVTIGVLVTGTSITILSAYMLYKYANGGRRPRIQSRDKQTSYHKLADEHFQSHKCESHANDNSNIGISSPDGVTDPETEKNTGVQNIRRSIVLKSEELKPLQLKIERADAGSRRYLSKKPSKCKCSRCVCAYMNEESLN